VPGGTGNFITGCTKPGVSGPVKVIATDIGSDYNAASGASFTVAGFSSKMSAKTSDGISGGDKHTAKIATASDVQTALDQLKQQNTDAEKKKLVAKFPSATSIIDDSFTASTGAPTSTPAIGDEVTGTAKVSVDVTYTLVGVAKSSIEAYLKDAIGKQISTNDQRIYDNGASSAKLSGFQTGSDQ
jgi:hypothetical protein